jgi:hypothetical protein
MILNLFVFNSGHLMKVPDCQLWGYDQGWWFQIKTVWAELMRLGIPMIYRLNLQAMDLADRLVVVQ